MNFASDSKGPFFRFAYVCLCILYVQNVHGIDQRTTGNDDNGNTTSIPVITPSCACGAENGEDVTAAHRFPWMTGLVNKQGVYCGSALISQEYVITAAHCVINESPDSMQVLLGASYYVPISPDPFAIEKIIIHPNFNKTNYESDIALVKMKVPVQYDTSIRPVCLVPKDLATDNMQSTACGWGKNEEGGKENQTLKCVAKGDASQGDGCPLFTQLNSAWYLIGIGCGQEGDPEIYTKVSAYADWIDEETKDSAPCEGIVIKKPFQPNPEDCGLPNYQVQTRVVGGTAVQAMEYPWMAAIEVNGQLKAAGTLISSSFVLTSALWMETSYLQNLNTFDIYLGRSDLSTPESTTKAYRVKNVYVHPNLNYPATYSNDIALIELTENVDSIFKSVCLPRSNDILPDGSPVVGAGWGIVNSSDAAAGYSNVIMEVTLNIVNFTTCNNTYTGDVTEDMICAEAPNKDMCFGDTGAPLTSEYQGRMYLEGVTSWGSGEGCAIPNYPSVFSAVNRYLPWISNVTGITVA